MTAIVATAWDRSLCGRGSTSERDRNEGRDPRDVFTKDVGGWPANCPPANRGGVDPMTLPPPPDRWTIELANAQRLEAVAAFGFTERQARFLLSVLLHSGVFRGA